MKDCVIDTKLSNKGKKIMITADFTEDGVTVFLVTIYKEKPSHTIEQFNETREHQQLKENIHGFIDDFKANDLGKALKHHNIKYFDSGKYTKIQRFKLNFKGFSLNCQCDFINGGIKKYIEIPYSQNQYKIEIDIQETFILDKPNADLLYADLRNKTYQQILLDYAGYNYKTNQISKIGKLPDISESNILYKYDRTTLSTPNNLRILLSPKVYNLINTVNYLINNNVLSNNPMITIKQFDYDKAYMFGSKHVGQYVYVLIDDIQDGKAIFGIP